MVEAELAAPAFSVIIATYNWSAALAVAVQSVLDQTLGDFELLVVGDCCTDDSEAVVEGFGDARIRWHNLAHNCGSQWGPNNAGLALARGRFVAYLGHDDLWMPSHLRAALSIFESTGADVVAGATLLYGPPGSGIRAVTGFFPNDTFSPMHFFPPSSMAHRLELAQRIGGWRGPEAARHSVDYDFLARCHAAGASFAATGEFSVFKFNAAWRRDSYLRRDAGEQRRCLAAVHRDGQAFLCRELAGALRACTEDRLVRIEAPMAAEADAVEGARFNQAFKGSHRGSRKSFCPRGVDGPVCFPRDAENEGFEWHAFERHTTPGGFRWSGPATRSEIVLPVRVDRELVVSIVVVLAIVPGLLEESSLQVNGSPVETTIEVVDGVVRWKAKAAPDRSAPGDEDQMRLTFTVPRTYRPLDLGMNFDRRWLGLAIGPIELDRVPAVADAPTGTSPCC